MGAEESTLGGHVHPDDKVRNHDEERFLRLVAGVDINGTHVSVGLMDEYGAFYGPKDVTAIGGSGTSPVWWEHLGEIHTPSLMANRIAGLIRLALSENNKSLTDLKAIGVSVAGVVDVQSGVVNSAHKLKDWKKVPLRSMIAQELSYEGPMVLETGANSALLAEMWVGGYKNNDNAVLLTLGDQVSGAVLCDGKLLRGSRGLAAKMGETILVPEGRSHGDAAAKGTLNAYVSTSAVVARALENEGPPADSALASSPKPLECAEIFKQAMAGDKFALKLAKETAKYLAVGLVNFCRLLDPDVILLEAGAMVGTGDVTMKEAMMKLVSAEFAAQYLNIEPVRVNLHGASVGLHAGVLGAGKAALQMLPSEA